jgi:hypothetical protein
MKRSALYERGAPRSIPGRGQERREAQSAASQAIQQLETEFDVQPWSVAAAPAHPEAGVPTRRAGPSSRGSSGPRGLATSRQRVEAPVRVAAIYSVGLHDMSRHTAVRDAPARVRL